MILDIVNQYRILSKNIDPIIKMSGLKIGHLQREMGMDNVTFYTRRKHGKFSIDELERLLKIIDIEKLEDKILMEMSLEGEESGVLSDDEKRLLLDEN